MPEPAGGAAPSGVVVLGMHRSGTSAATGLVSKLGLNTCIAADRLDEALGNAKGHFESISMVAVNDELLAQMGRCWWCPPRWGAAGADDLARVWMDPAEARRAFDASHFDSPWVWKDPRTALTLPFWRRALDPFAAVVVVRNPLDVAKSLHARSKLRLTHGVALWERYNRHLLSNLEGLPAIVTRYDDLVEDPVGWCADVVDYLCGVGIPCRVPPEEEVREFVEPSLRHASSSRTELFGSFGSSAGVHDALEASVGRWQAYEAPTLAPESPWIEAELTAMGSWQRDRVPKPSPAVVSVVVVVDPLDRAAASAALRSQLLSYMEGVVVVRGEPGQSPSDDAGQSGQSPSDEESIAGTPPVRTLSVPAGTPLGAARAAGVAAARAELVEFRLPFASPTQHWPPELRRAIAAGYAAVSPVVEWDGGGKGYGLAFHGRFLNLRWLPEPEDTLATVPLLAGACFAIRRDVLVACGGLDGELGAYDFDAYELSLRLWRLGERVAVVTQASVSAPAITAGVGGLEPAGGLDWRRFAHDLLRLGTLHLSATRLATLVEGVREHPECAPALARVLTSDATRRREELAAKEAPLADGLLAGDEVPDGTQLDPPPSVDAARAGRRRTTRVPVSLVVAGAGRAALRRSGVARLAAGLGRGSDVVVDRTRAAAARSARGEVLLFVDPAALPSVEAAGVLRDAAREQDCMAGPALLAHGWSTRRLGGLTYRRCMLDVRWAAAPEHAAPAPALAEPCLAVPRALYDQVGGYDDALERTGWAEAELALRLWRSGASCLVEPAAELAVPGSWWGLTPLHGDDVLFGLLHLAAVHLDAEDHERLLELATPIRGFPAAVATCRRRRGCAAARCVREGVPRGRRRGAAPVLRGSAVRAMTGQAVPGWPSTAARLQPAAGSPSEVERAGPAAAPERDASRYAPVFLLSPARSNSSVVTAMIGMHPQMYAFPELTLFRAETVGDLLVNPPAWRGPSPERRAAGLVRAIAELHEGSQDGAAAGRALAWLRARGDWQVAWVLDHLLELVDPLIGIEKSPEDSMRVDYLERLDGCYPRARYLHLTRHPLTAVESMHAAWAPLRLWDAPDERLHTLFLGFWLFHHLRLTAFTARLPPERWLRVRSEDVLNEPRPTLLRVCRWLELDTSATSIEAMLHPERSPYAGLGPALAPGGNDPGFLRSPERRATRIPASLDLPLWWGLDPWMQLAVLELASRLGYCNDRAGAADLAPTLEADEAERPPAPGDPREPERAREETATMDEPAERVVPRQGGLR